MAKASPARSGDYLAGVAADVRRGARGGPIGAGRRAAVAISSTELVVPYETDDVTRLIIDTHDTAAFAPVAHLTVGGFRDWLLSYEATSEALTALAPGLTPEMVAAVSKIMRIQDLDAGRAEVPRRDEFRNTIGLKGRLSTRLQPNHPTDDPTRHRRHRCSTGCSTATATPSSASTRRPTASRRDDPDRTLIDVMRSATTSRPSPAC